MPIHPVPALELDTVELVTRSVALEVPRREDGLFNLYVVQHNVARESRQKDIKVKGSLERVAGEKEVLLAMDDSEPPLTTAS
jgi:hypothetical protein